MYTSQKATFLMCCCTSLLSLFCVNPNFAQSQNGTFSATSGNYSTSSDQSPFHEFTMLSGAENIKIIEQFSNQDECHTVSVSQGNTKIQYYEWLKVHKTEGIFYSFDEEKEIISAMYRFRKEQNYTTVLKSLICENGKATEITLLSCEANLNKNKSLLRKMTDHYLSRRSSDTGNKQFKK